MPTSVLPQLLEISELEEQKAVFEDEAKKVDAKIRDCLSDIRKALENSATTGDPLRDLVIKDWGISEVVEKRYRLLQKRLVGKKGEFVLIPFATKVPHKHTFGEGYEYRDARCYRLGVLEAETLVWEKDVQITLPISRYISGEEGFVSPSEVHELHKENIFAHAFGGFHEGDPPLLRELINGDCGYVIVIGDEAVRKWLKEQRMQGLFKSVADALSKLVLEPTD